MGQTSLFGHFCDIEARTQPVSELPRNWNRPIPLWLDCTVTLRKQLLKEDS